jgi:prepilin-type N-terminal cleavage/methylation domain-containing protein
MRKFQPRILGKNKKKQGGFTLIELVIVIIIAGILGAAIVATYIDLTTEAEEANVEQTVAALNTGIATYIAQNNGTSPVAATAAALVTKLQGTNNIGPTPNGLTVTDDNITVNGVDYGVTLTNCTDGGVCNVTAD